MDSRSNFVEETRKRSSRLHSGRVEPEREHTVRIESGIDSREMNKTLKQQASAEQQYHRQHYFADN